MEQILYIRFGKAQRLKWLGYIMGMEDNRLVVSITEWKPLGMIVKKKPWKRCMDDLLDDVKIMRMTNWMRNVRNREVLHKIVEKAKTHKGL